jgi:hypothetical protein
MASLELNLDEFTKEELIYLILHAHEKDLTFNQVIERILKENLDILERKEADVK